eukprot:m.28693 g.28693  ORF g.28693 m.28693 type:complete len:104 (-) comp9493_c0_seq3:407-718(-)
MYSIHCITFQCIVFIVYLLLTTYLQPYNIRVVGYYPTSMDTPGFEVEERTKPKETKAIEGQGGLIKPEKAAKNLINGSITVWMFLQTMLFTIFQENYHSLSSI